MADWHLRIARRLLRCGGVIAYPTEAVFGLGCNPWDQSAVRRIVRLKRRRAGKGLILVSGELRHIEPLVDFSGVDRDAILRTWPGPMTWVLPWRVPIPAWITGGSDCVAVRVSAHPVIAALCAGMGPIVSTSANPEGQPPARTAERVRAYFGSAVDFIVPGTPGPSARPTEIRDGRTGAVLRKGG